MSGGATDRNRRDETSLLRRYPSITGNDITYGTAAWGVMLQRPAPAELASDCDVAWTLVSAAPTLMSASCFVGYASACPGERSSPAPLAIRAAGNRACRRPFRPPSRYATNFPCFAAGCLRDTKPEKYLRTTRVVVTFRRQAKPPAPPRPPRTSRDVQPFSSDLFSATGW